MVKNLVKDEFGRSFIIIRRSHSSSHTDKANPFGLGRDSIFVKSFIRRLRAPMSYWHWLAMEFGLSLRQGKSAEELICDQVLQQRLQFVEVTDVIQSQSVNRQIGKTNRNKHVELVLPLAHKLRNSRDDTEPKSFSSRDEALKYMDGVALDDKRVKELANAMGIASRGPTSGLVPAGQTPPATLAVADALASGELLLFERDPLSSPPPRSAAAPEEPVGASARPATLGPHESGVPVKAWVEVQLLNDAGEPISGEEYCIKDPDGAEHKGKTNAKGIARVTGVSPGNCEVTFPNVDKDAISQG